MTLSNELRQRLIQAACDARRQAYAPYSGFPVGAAVLTDDNEIVPGANVENASFGLTVCAERVAIWAAVAAGQRVFRAVAIASQGGVAPCGACRQVMAEFDRKLALLLIDADHPDEVQETTLDRIFPQVFALPDRSDDDG